MTHGDTPGLPVEALIADDPDLHNVHANMAAWHETHPCDCHAMCECDEADR